MNNNYEASSFEDRNIKSGLKTSTLSNNKTMNNNYKIKETHNVSESSSFEDRKIKSGLKTSTLRNNKSMNNRITIKDTPVQNTSKTHVETPRMRRSTCLSEIKSGLKTSTLSNNKTMNSNYKIKETHNVSEASSFEDRKIKSGLKTSTLRNNKSMNNDYRTTIMDTPVQHVETPRMRRLTCPLNIKSGLMESALRNNKTMNNNNKTYIMDDPVPHIGVATLSPTPFIRIIRSLRDTARKAANTAKRKWNEYYDWLSTYVPPPIRVPPNSLK